jgi:hypothetical protein
MFGRIDEGQYLGIDQAMKNIEPIPLSPRQRANVAKIKPQSFIVIALLFGMCFIIPIATGKMEALPFVLAVVGVIAVVALLLAVKDKLRVNSFDRVYIVRGFVEKRIRIKGGYMLRMRYHDFLRNEIRVITKSEPSELLFDKSVAVEGRGVELIMGEKNGKLKYVTLKTPKIDE